MKDKMKTKPKIKITWPGLKKNYWNDGSTRNINGVLLTCILLSFASGFIDLVFFSGLSKSVYNVANIPVAASILFTIMSIGFISAKFWCAGRIGMLRELKSRLKAKGKTWYKNINKALLPWHIAHKFLIVVSLITAVSLSVVSIGDAIRKNQNVIKRANTDIEKITKLANTTDKSDEVQFSALIKSSTASETAVDRAQADAAKIWPKIEAYRKERADFTNQFGANKFGMTETVTWKGQEIIPNTYWDNENEKIRSEVRVVAGELSIQQIRTLSEADITTIIKTKIETSTSNSASNKLEELSAQTKNKAIQEIENLQGRYFMPGSDEAVVFDPNNISGAIATLGDIKAAYENDTGDVGESSKVFMLVGPVLDKKNQTTASDVEEAYLQEVDTSSFGSTEIMMMILIMAFGIVQEFLIAIFTPKATIDRKMLSQVSSYLEWKDEEEKERFLISVYKDYVGDGIINQEDFDAKVKKCVTLMEDTEEDIIAKYSKHTVKAPKAVKVRAEKPLPNIDTDVSTDYFESDELDDLINKTEELIKK